MAVVLTLVRGLPGSGKSTLAKTIRDTTGAVHLESDMFFMKDGVSYTDMAFVPMPPVVKHAV